MTLQNSFEQAESSQDQAEGGAGLSSMEEIKVHIVTERDDKAGDSRAYSPPERAKLALVKNFGKGADFVDMGSASIGLNIGFSDEARAKYLDDLSESIEEVAQYILESTGVESPSKG